MDKSDPAGMIFVCKNARFCCRALKCLHTKKSIVVAATRTGSYTFSLSHSQPGTCRACHVMKKHKKHSKSYPMPTFLFLGERSSSSRPNSQLVRPSTVMSPLANRENARLYAGSARHRSQGPRYPCYHFKKYSTLISLSVVSRER